MLKMQMEKSDSRCFSQRKEHRRIGKNKNYLRESQRVGKQLEASAYAGLMYPPSECMKTGYRPGQSDWTKGSLAAPGVAGSLVMLSIRVPDLVPTLFRARTSSMSLCDWIEPATEARRLGVVPAQKTAPLFQRTPSRKSSSPPTL